MHTQQTDNLHINNSSSDKLRKQVNLVAKLIAIFLVAGFFSFFQLKSQILQSVTFLSLIIPAFLQIRYGLANMASVHRTFMFALLYLIPVSISFLLNLLISGTISIKSAMILINLYFTFYIASIFASCFRFDLWRRTLHYIALFALPIFIYVVVTQQHAYRWGRWEPFDMQPNWWGMMVMCVAWGASAWGNIKLRAIVIFASFLFLIEVQARGAIIALLPVLFFSSGFFLPLSRKKTIWLLFGLLIIATGALLSSLIMEKGLIEYAVNYIINNVLLFHDSHRGIGTGLTGRMEGYSKAWEVFISSPAFGSGFGEYGFIHNGFLMTLAESGLFGLTGMLFIIGMALINSVKNKDLFMLGLLLSYITAIMTFPRTFNINMTGFMFIVLVMVGCRTISNRSTLQK
ncbi:MAG: hypothetical protein HF967_01905 [Methanosarcinales archaeon]|nr:hypothetical protein [Methanosarcinales archaeon]